MPTTNTLYGKALVVLSGGQDSTTCLAIAKQRYAEVHAVTFNYGQLHAAEIECAKKQCNIFKVASHEIVDVGPILAGSSPLTNRAEALEQYQDHNSLPGGLEKTYVPHRNLLFLTLAANRAYVMDAEALFTGVCQEDFGGYPDCRRVFIDALEKTIWLSGEKQLFINTPLMQLSKAASILLAMDIPHCYGALAFTHTSYDGQYPPIGKDHATLLREKGFVEARVPDPLVVRAALIDDVMELPDLPNYKNSGLIEMCLDEISTVFEMSKDMNVDPHETLKQA
jgi:7-cyano-7-deazaguanine synthase